jgi:hypothetical protein
MSTFQTAFTTAGNIARIQALRPDLAAAGFDTAAEIYDWYLRHGKTELTGGTAPSAITGIDESYIATIRPDVAAAFAAGTIISISEWYLNTANDGLAASVAPSATFNAASYFAGNPDLAAAGLTVANALTHYVVNGASEGRFADGSGFDTTLGGVLTASTSTGVTGSSFSLTSGTDSVTGTANNDTITADLINESGVANVTTINSTDIIDGGAGTDSLTAVYDDAVSATISNVETLTLSDRAGVAFNFVNVSGVQNIVLTASTAAVDLDNIVALPTLLTVNNQAQNINDDFAAAAVAGSTDALAMAVSSVTGGTFTIDSGIETLSIAANGSAANTVAGLTATGVTNLTLTGSADLTITADLGATIATVDGSAATGALTITQDGAVNATITGGTGNDRIDLGGDNFDTNDTINGGDGTDTIAMEEDDAIAVTTAAAQLANLSNFEVLDLTDQLAGNVTLTLFGAAAASAPTTLELSAGIDATDRTLTVASGSTIDLEANAGDDITIAVAGSGTSDTATLILDNADIAANIQATSLESLTINSTGAGTVTNTVTGTTAINSIAGTQTITVTGEDALTFTGAVTADAIDASAFTGVLTLTAGTAATASVTGGTGNDILDLGDDNADIAVGGAGDDTITFDVEVTDQVRGGDGADIFLMDHDTDTAYAGAVISDLTTADDLNLDNSSLEAFDGAGALTDFANADMAVGDLTFTTIAADSTALTSGSIAVITGKTYANEAAVEADILTAGARTFTFATTDDDDTFLIAYELTSGGVEIAAAQANGAVTSSNDINAFDVFVTLEGLTAATLQTMDINLVA